MGPRSDERGNVQTPIHLVRSSKLQWGRAQMSAEILTLGVGLLQRRGLQWGRAQMSAEIYFLQLGEVGIILLQWGRAQMSAEIPASQP